MTFRRLVLRMAGSVLVAACSSSASQTSGSAPAETDTATASSIPVTLSTTSPSSAVITSEFCAITPVLKGIQDGPDATLVALLAESPLAAQIEAAWQSLPMPPVTDEAAMWVVRNHEGRDYNLQALDIAIWLNCPEMVVEILALGVPAEGSIPELGWTPAISSARLGEWTVVEVLLAAGADPLKRDETDPFSSVLEQAARVDVATLEMVLEYADLENSAARLVLDDALTAAAATEDEQSVEAALQVVNRLVGLGARPAVGALLQTTSVLSPPEIFEALIGTAGNLDYSQEGFTEADADGLQNLCYALDPANQVTGYDHERLDRLVMFLSSFSSDSRSLCPGT